MEEPVSSRGFSCTAKYPNVEAFRLSRGVEMQEPVLLFMYIAAAERIKYQLPPMLLVLDQVHSTARKWAGSHLSCLYDLAHGWRYFVKDRESISLALLHPKFEAFRFVSFTSSCDLMQLPGISPLTSHEDTRYFAPTSILISHLTLRPTRLCL
jgi:hypothetical protein